MQTRQQQNTPAADMTIGEWQARLRAGKEAKKRAGGYVGGRPTIGFRAQSGQLIADAREQAIISRCLELRSAGYTYRQIAEILKDEGRRNRAGTTTWHPETISRICRQPD
jgi:Recombinase